ncbi:hypothetical protein [Dehalogenimonas alkenigignens]|uniref:hypothetical protein n=1 Tax=Dehalogenimonas alkenigignens TaxID=1217799 RepID=UPI000D564791|nr:hypothetical protein [Dehalogenimonas alkenigignens]PVV85115.1 hypothetical protein DD509_02175 [Dehalogenimonas alkenigignens]
MKALKRFLIPAIAAVLAMSVAIPALAKPITMANESQGQSGTTLSASKTATGFWEQTWTYDWTVTKSVSPDAIELDQDESEAVTYTVTATRGEPTITNVYGVRGTITVTNGGAIATEGLTIRDIVQTKTGAGQFEDYVSKNIPVSAQLQPGETATYSYEFVFDPVADALYRNVAVVTITNHSGHLGEDFGPEPKADFSLPTTPTIFLVDESASLTDAVTVPDGFTYNTSQTFPVAFNDSGVLVFSATITNVSVTTGGTHNLVNTVTLTETDTLQTRTDDALVVITVPDGGGGDDEEPGDGQGLSPGFWKTHPDAWTGTGYSTGDPLGGIFDLGDFGNLGDSTLLEALNFGGSGEYGWAKTLLRQAVAALLNAAYFGVDYGMSEQNIIDEVNSALASGDSGDLQSDLDDANNQGGEVEDPGPADPTPGYEKDNPGKGKKP